MRHTILRHHMCHHCRGIRRYCFRKSRGRGARLCYMWHINGLDGGLSGIKTITQSITTISQSSAPPER